MTEDYRDYLKFHFFNKKDSQPSYFTITKLAQAARVQKTYMSRALKQESHLNQDQLFLSADFLHLNKWETQYLINLSELNRSTIPKRKEALTKELQALSKKIDIPAEKLQLETPDELIAGYYDDPLHQIVHMALGIEKYAKNPLELCQDLRLEKEYFQRILKRLIQHSIIKQTENGIKILLNFIHLPAHSSSFKTHTIRSRLKSIENFSTSIDQERLHFTVVFSAEEETQNKIKKEILNCLDNIKNLVEAADSQGVYQLNLDLFPWLNSD